MDKVYMLTVKTVNAGEDDTIDIELYATKKLGDKAFDERVASTKDVLNITEDDVADVDGPKPIGKTRWATLDNGDTTVDISLQPKVVNN